jgi:lipid-binding SYLF domain-containing protein
VIIKEDVTMKYFHLTTMLLALLVACIFVCPEPVSAASAAEINHDVKSALHKLYAKSAAARALGEKAKGILVFPGIVKAGFIVGGQYGEGALLKQGKIAGYYSTVQASFGLQAGVQKYGYALFFMTDSALKWIDKSGGWELGVGPSIVVVDIGAATSATTTTLQSEIYAFFFNPKGLMGGLGIQGTKVTRIEK